MARAEQTFAVAHVTPYPWEAQDNEVNAHVRTVAEELSRRGHRVLVLAPSRSHERVRASRRALRAARGRGGGAESLLKGTDEGTPLVIAVGEVLDVPSLTSGSSERSHGRRPLALPIDVARTIEELLSAVPLDFVHVHEPFAPSVSAAALRHSRALNVGSFHAAGERGVLSRSVGRRFVETFLGRLDARIAATPATAALMAKQFPGEYRVAGGPSEGGAGNAKDSVKGDVAGVGPGGEDEYTNRGDSRARARAYAYARAAADLETIYSELAARRHDPLGDRTLRQRLAGRPKIDVDLHMHTDHSYDCATPVEVLLTTAHERGLGAIAVTDHNEISGALAARERARQLGIDIKVIVGEEVKTASQGEVIGLFIEQKIPKGMTLAETIAEIKRQGGLVYVPHPFDRLHSVPDYEHLLGVVSEIDAIEVFNPRVAINAFNEEAERFAAKYRIAAGAGSDSHVAQGLGSVRLRMPSFDGPAEFKQALTEAEIL
ncbi:MAG TPA: PHP domain-containing protein, partial [Solirubrobacteraceae bacterium]|nr:PHP domain-containing protein [Solirubrobacteraceae bacterium]